HGAHGVVQLSFWPQEPRMLLIKVEARSEDAGLRPRGRKFPLHTGDTQPAETASRARAKPPIGARQPQRRQSSGVGVGVLSSESQPQFEILAGRDKGAGQMHFFVAAEAGKAEPEQVADPLVLVIGA